MTLTDLRANLEQQRDDKYEDFSAKLIPNLPRERFIVMITRLFAEAPVKQWDAAVPFLTENRLPIWVHNMTIRKACESFRITEDQKRC